VDERIKARQRREQLLREVRSPGGLQLRRIGCIIVHRPSIHPSNPFGGLSVHHPRAPSSVDRSFAR
jgi:hypothetical protein